MIGETLGHYRVREQLGRGGMGEVYLADDLSLDRKVALKFLPDEFANDAERMARFEREAKLLASLNHPNIAAIHGLEQAEGRRFIVMEFVEGETLDQRLSKGPIAIEDTLGICRQVAEALEAAHEKGIIHRDLKPANVMIAAGDRVKVLDFGLAKALSGEIPSVDSSQSPTLTEAMTRPGVILGTAAYMSPEQAKGKPVDKRADIWAFGCILYECLTGKRAFEGESVTETLAAILRGEPDWRSLPAATPMSVRFALRGCLEKNLNRRFRDAADVQIEIDESKTAPGAMDGIAGGIQIAWWKALLLFAGALALGAAIAALTFWYLVPSQPKTPVHLNMSLPPGEKMAGVNLPLAFSPDGSRLALVSSRSGGVSQLYIRALDKSDAQLIPGTDGASAPFFSPDGQWIAFFAQGELKKVSVAGGATLKICAAGANAGGAWGPDSTIVFSPSFSSGLLRVSASGGTPQILTTLDASKGEISHRYPQFMPSGKALLYSVLTGFGWDNQHIVLEELETGKRRTLIRGGHTGRVVPTGYLVYYRAGKLLAVPFDLKRKEVTSNAAVAIIEGIRQSDAIAGEFSFSDTGSLAYIPGPSSPHEWRLAWINRTGKTELLAAPVRNYEGPKLSPDGRQVVVEISTNTSDLWIYDLERDSLTRLSSEGSSQYPVWTPDGRRVAYRATRGGFRNIFWRAADGTGVEERLTAGENQQTPSSWSPGGKALAFWEASPTTGSDIWILHPEDKPSAMAVSKDQAKPQSFIQTPSFEAYPMFSPDGRWVAYTSDKSGGFEVYICPFAGPGREWQVSTDGGRGALWAPDGRELFYKKGDQIFAVDFQTKPTFAIGKPRLLFETEANVCDITPDGKRFLVIQSAEPQKDTAQIPVVLNWFEELKRKVPRGK